MGFWDTLTGIGQTIQKTAQQVAQTIGGGINQGIATFERTFKVDLPGGLTKEQLQPEKKPQPVQPEPGPAHR